MTDEKPVMSEKEIVKFLERKKKELEGRTPPYLTEGPPEGVCVVCGTLTVIVRMVIESSLGQMTFGCKSPSRQDGYYCVNCGLRYEFPTKPPVCTSRSSKRRNRTKK